MPLPFYYLGNEAINPNPIHLPSGEHYLGFTKAAKFYSLRLDKPKILHFRNSLISEIDVWVYQKGKLIQEFNSGLFRKKNTESFYSAGFAIPAKLPGEYLFLIKTEDTHRIHFRMLEETEFRSYAQSTNLWQGFYVGLCIFIAILSFAQWIVIRDRLYLLLTFATLAVLITSFVRSGLLYEFGFGEIPYFFRYSPILYTLSPLTLLCFVLRFANMKEEYPRLFRFIQLYMLLILVASTSLFFDLQTYFRFIYSNNLIMTFGLFVLSGFFFLHRKEFGPVLFLAISVRQISILILVLSNLNLIASDPIITSANEIGAALQMAIFTLAISKFQIQTRLKKEETVIKENALLETMVEIRTREIQKQKDDLEKAIEQIKYTESQLVFSEKMSELGKLIAGVAHEVNNPLSAIKASIETIIESNVEETRDLRKILPLLLSLKKEEIDTVQELLHKLSDFGLVASYSERKVIKADLKASVKSDNDWLTEEILEKFLDVGITSLTDQEINLFSKLPLPLMNWILVRKYNRLHFEIIQIAADRASNTIRSLKDFSRHTKNEDPKEFSLISNIETVLTIYQFQMRGKVSLTKTFITDAIIFGWPEEMMRVWTNLILNGLEAMSYNGNLMICTEKIGNEIEIRIIDNGTGIPLEVQNLIFERHFTTKIPGKGTGMGLEITKSIVEKHEGRVHLNSEPGRTCFSIYLPVVSFKTVSQAVR